MTNKFHDEQAFIPQVTGYQLPEPPATETAFTAVEIMLKVLKDTNNLGFIHSFEELEDAISAGESELKRGPVAWLDTNQVRESAYQAGRESMRQECLQECSAEATDNGTAQRIAKSIEGIK